MNYAPTFRTQVEELAELRIAHRDPSGATSRWSDAEIYNAINMALNDWHKRVQVPHFYDIDFTSGTYEYDLPDYIDDSNLDVEVERTVWGLNIQGDTWNTVYTDVTAWHVTVDSSGDKQLVIENNLGSGDGRIIWWGYNGNVPTTIPALNAEITAAATSLVLDSVVTGIGRSGYVKINNEWLFYADVSDDGSNTTLGNLLRGLDGTTAAVHAADDDVTWGIAVPDHSLWNQMFNQVGRTLHLLPLSSANVNETEGHERMLGYFKNEIDEFWRNWIPIRPGRMKLSRMSMGEPTIF